MVKLGRDFRNAGGMPVEVALARQEEPPLVRRVAVMHPVGVFPCRTFVLGLQLPHTILFDQHVHLVAASGRRAQPGSVGQADQFRHGRPRHGRSSLVRPTVL